MLQSLRKPDPISGIQYIGQTGEIQGI
jgi:hypothetical protein